MKVFSSPKFLVWAVLVFFVLADFSYADEISAGNDPASYVGFTLEMLFAELGMPTSVHAVRGMEIWQDDVVFVYPAIEIYLFKDRVWQICPISVYDMKIGDAIDHVKTTMGEPIVSTDQYLLYRLPSQSWPMMLRINLNQEEKAASFFIYRSDF
jgi:hypothetical protein